MKQVGIWIDKREAKIVSIDNGEQRLDTIISDIEDFHIGGGSGSRSKGGPQDVVQDSKYLERESHQLTEFFKDIANNINGTDAVVIFGPAQTGEKLYKDLMEKHSYLNNKIKPIEKADNMTDNQIVAWVKEYYG